jgi:Beta-lactamase enzyme family
MSFPKLNHRKSRSFFGPRGMLLLISLVCFSTTIYQIVEKLHDTRRDSECLTTSHLSLVPGDIKSIKGQLQAGEISCFSFNAVSEQILTLQTNTKLRVFAPNGKSFLTQGGSRDILRENGKYLVRLDDAQVSTYYQISIALLGNNKNLLQANIPSQQGKPATYTTRNESNLKLDSKLQNIVEDTTKLVQTSGLPIDKLSVSLIDLNTASYGEYQELTPRFPASLAKLFWLVALFGYYDSGKLPQGEIPNDDLYKMMQDSDNNIASRILDQLTDTKSGNKLASEDFKQWISKRKSINNFFTNSGYSDLNISQKNFPISELNLTKPTGRDEQMRENPSQPVRNSLTSHAVARLLFEIDQGKAVSPEYSQQAKSLMMRNFTKESTKQYDSIKSFLGEGLDPNLVQMHSKPGWTSDSRQDAAIVYSRDGKTRYILVVIGEDPRFAYDWHIFPRLSRLVYERMRN